MNYTETLEKLVSCFDPSRLPVILALGRGPVVVGDFPRGKYSDDSKFLLEDDHDKILHWVMEQGLSFQEPTDLEIRWAKTTVSPRAYLIVIKAD
jgi:hypothetical protein